MKYPRLYWRLRAAWARWQTRHNPRPSTDQLLRRIYGDENHRGRR